MSGAEFISNSLIKDLLINVAASGLTSIISYSYEKSKDFSFIKKENKMNQAISNGFNDYVGNIDLAEKVPLRESACFLRSPQAEMIIRRLYSIDIESRLSGLDEKSYLEHLREEFLDEYSTYIGVDRTILRAVSNSIFNELVINCKNTLNMAINDGNLFAHEAMSNLREHVIISELQNIKNIISGNLEYDPEILRKGRTFIDTYIKQVEHAHTRLVPPQFDKIIKLPISEIYVEPLFEKLYNKAGQCYINLFDLDNEEPYTLKEFLSSSFRVVIVGNPGGGKTTLAHKLCFDFASEYPRKRFANRVVLPIIVGIREYGVMKKKKGKCSILKFIEENAESKYQLPKVPKGIFEALFISGQAIVIFDGLDELIDGRYMLEICNNIESFCNLYPATPVIVTTREIGYKKAPLDQKEFETFRILPFNEEQIQRYAANWFRLDGEINPEKKADDLLKETDEAQDIRSNPLILALICNMYRGKSSIPKKRTDIYRKCALMLYDEWDRIRDVHTPPLEAHLRFLIGNLANYIYTKNANQSIAEGITYKELISVTKKYLFERRFESQEEAEQAAKEFIDFCQHRAWVFSKVSTKNGESIYNFTHRTFLEYFAAEYISRTNELPLRLFDKLKWNIIGRENDNSSLLAVQSFNETHEDGASTFLSELLNYSKNFGAAMQEKNFLDFAILCLKFIIPSSDVAKRISSSFLSFYMDKMNEIYKKEIKGIDIENFDEQLIRSFISLLNVDRDNRNAVARGIELELGNAIDSDNEFKASLATELVLFLDGTQKIAENGKFIETNLENFWKNVALRLMDVHDKKINKLAKYNLGICMDLFIRDKISVDHLIECHGIESIFFQVAYDFNFHACRYSIVESLFNSLTKKFRNKKYIDSLETIGRISISHSFMLKDITDNYISWMSLLNITLNVEDIEYLRRNGDLSFGVLAILAALLERELEHRVSSIDIRRQTIERLKRDGSPIINEFRYILLSRFDETSEREFNKELEGFNFSSRQRQYISDWANNKRDFVYPC